MLGIEKAKQLPRWFEIISFIAVIASLVVYTISTEASLRKLAILKISENVLVALFSIEYILRIYTAENKRRYLFSFYGIVDFVAILPGLITLGLVNLNFIRIFRLLRVLRLFKLARYTMALDRFKNALSSILEELAIFIIATIVVIYISSVGIYHFESKVQPEQFGSIAQCFWWSIVTLSTVGFGDSYPVTALGKVFTTFVVFVGLGVVAVPSGLLASALTKTNSKK